MSPAVSALSMLEHRVRVLRWIALGSLVVSAGALTLALVVVLRAPGPPSAAALPVRLDELTVGRLNVVEPDGATRHRPDQTALLAIIASNLFSA